MHFCFDRDWSYADTYAILRLQANLIWAIFTIYTWIWWRKKYSSRSLDAFLTDNKARHIHHCKNFQTQKNLLALIPGILSWCLAVLEIKPGTSKSRGLSLSVATKPYIRECSIAPIFVHSFIQLATFKVLWHSFWGLVQF